MSNLELPDIPTLGPGQTLVVQREEEVPQEAKKGLFGLKKKMPSTIRQTNYVYMPHPMSASRSNPPPTSATSSHFPPTSATTSEGSYAGFQQPPPTSAATSEQPTSPRTAQSFMQGNDTQSDHTETTPDVIYFNQDTDFAPLLNHYPYSVSYERVKYPTATHLLEALKFLPENDRNHGIAELIRTCEDTADVYRLSQEHADAQNEVDDDSYMQTVSVPLLPWIYSV
ncbi:hypothetical protein C0991_006882 [Blastosporella zonata]|nr:hypothetical protein C0991_006882 [Blastosporella zonata]